MIRSIFWPRKAVVLCGIVAFLVLAVVGMSEVVDQSVCTLAANPDTYSTRKVRIRGSIIRSIEGSLIFDNLCKSEGIILWIEKSARNNSDFKELNAALLGHSPNGPIGTVVTATFTGEFIWRPKKAPHRVLLADSVEDIEVRQTPEQP